MTYSNANRTINKVNGSVSNRSLEFAATRNANRTINKVNGSVSNRSLALAAN